MRTLVIAFALLLSGCTLHAGVVVHPPSKDAPEITRMDNPLGVLRLEHKFGNKTVGYCEHTSSIPVRERGYGLNVCGIMREIGVIYVR